MPTKAVESRPVEARKPPVVEKKNSEPRAEAKPREEVKVENKPEGERGKKVDLEA